MKAGSPILYPQVSRLPGQTGLGEGASGKIRDSAKPGEFDAILQDTQLRAQDASEKLKKVDLNGTRDPLKISAHAALRLKERSISIDQDLMSRMNVAIDQADAKGLTETLVLTDKAAMIVSVPNRTIITAMDKDNLRGNVFTNIDGAVIV